MFNTKKDLLKIWWFVLTKKEKDHIANALGYNQTRYVLPYLQKTGANPYLKEEYISILGNLYSKEKWDEWLKKANEIIEENNKKENNTDPSKIEVNVPGAFLYEVKTYKYVCACNVIATIELFKMATDSYGCQAKLEANNIIITDSKNLFYPTSDEALQGIVTEIESKIQS